MTQANPHNITFTGFERISGIPGDDETQDILDADGNQIGEVRKWMQDASPSSRKSVPGIYTVDFHNGAETEFRVCDYDGARKAIDTAKRWARKNVPQPAPVDVEYLAMQIAINIGDTRRDGEDKTPWNGDDVEATEAHFETACELHEDRISGRNWEEGSMLLYSCPDAIQAAWDTITERVIQIFATGIDSRDLRKADKVAELPQVDAGQAPYAIPGRTLLGWREDGQGTPMWAYWGNNETGTVASIAVDAGRRTRNYGPRHYWRSTRRPQTRGASLRVTLAGAAW